MDLGDNWAQDLLDVTRSERSARIARTSRRDTPLGVPHNRCFNACGFVDFVGGRATLKRGAGDPGSTARPVSVDLPRPGERPPLAPEGPLWPFVVMAQPHGPSVALGVGDHRGDRVTRCAVEFEFPEVEMPFAAARRPRIRSALGIPPRASERPPIHAEVWVDSKGRVRLIGILTSPHPPLPRWVPKVMRRGIESVAGSADARVWDTTELWDFGALANDAEQ